MGRTLAGTSAIPMKVIRPAVRYKQLDLTTVVFFFRAKALCEIQIKRNQVQQQAQQKELLRLLCIRDVDIGTRGQNRECADLSS